MTPLEWLVIVAAGVVGYLVIAFVVAIAVGRRLRDQQPHD